MCILSAEAALAALVWPASVQAVTDSLSMQHRLASCRSSSCSSVTAAPGLCLHGIKAQYMRFQCLPKPKALHMQQTRISDAPGQCQAQGRSVHSKAEPQSCTASLAAHCMSVMALQLCQCKMWIAPVVAAKASAAAEAAACTLWPSTKSSLRCSFQILCGNAKGCIGQLLVQAEQPVCCTRRYMQYLLRKLTACRAC